MRRLMLPALVLALPVIAAAQQIAPKPLPDGWIVRADEPPKADVSKLSFVAMSRGWHITTNSLHAIFYRPANSATGVFTATLDAYLFGPPGPYPEGYGIFVGGKDLAGPNQSYLYFVAANNGTFLLKRRTGGTTSTVIDWTASPAIKTVPAGSDNKANVENVFKVQAGKDSVRFLINGKVVATEPRAGLGVDGIVGVRVNHNLSVHLAVLTIDKGR